MKKQFFAITAVLLVLTPAVSLAAGPFTISAPDLAGKPGERITVPVTVKNGGDAAPNSIVDVEIYNSANARVAQRFFEYQYLGPGSTRTYSMNWTPRAEGDYSLRVGVFGEHWSPLYTWNGNVETISVSNSASVTNSTALAPVSVLSAPASTVEVWWPTQGARLTGSQPLKAVLAGKNVSEYNMYWQVDGDRLNFMPSNYTGTPHKEVVVDFTGWKWKGSGPYTLNFVARDLGGKTLAQKSVSIYTGTAATPVVSVLAEEPVQTLTQPTTPTVSSTPTNSGNPFAGAKLYVNPYNEPKQWANQNRQSRPYEASLMDKQGDQPQTQWFGNWNSNVYQDVKNWVDAAAAQGALPVLVAYNIPQRDCGGYSAGGTGSPDAYRSWIRSFADAIGNRKAVVILEPDATALIDCLSAADKETRFKLLGEAVDILNAKGNISVYVDAGHPRWIGSSEMASRLQKAGVGRARGFALNVSNFMTNSENINYGQQISSQVGGKTFVIETSRNGLGPSPDNQWCNPPGRALGNAPTVATGHHLVDAYLWVKGPWGSDGQCNGGPAAGTFWLDYSLGLSQRANW